MLEAGAAVSLEAVSAWSEGRTSGPGLAGWRTGGGAVLGETVVCRARGVWVAPAFGVAVAADGGVFRATAGPLLPYRRGLGELPGAVGSGDAWSLQFEDEAPRLEAAALWRGWGGSFNYGHYLLDALPALLALEEAGLLSGAPPVSGPLQPWARDLLALAFPGLQPVESRAPWIRVEKAVWSTAMDHNLHRPGPLMLRLRERLLGPPDGPPLRLYFSRRGLSGRILVNEAALEAALRSRGYRVVHPERLSIAEQVALARRAEVVVGASGAAMANALFAPAGARVVEILPEAFAWPWVRDLCRLCGLDWRGWFSGPPVDPRAAPWFSRVRRGFAFAWRLELEPFLAWLDAG